MYDHKLALVIMKGKNKQTGDKKERRAGRKNLALDLGGGMGAGNTGNISLWKWSLGSCLKVMGAVGDRGSSIQDEKELGPFQGPKECYSESTGMESQRSEGQKSLYTEPYSQLSISRACQCSCLENPRDGGAWWAAVYGVAQSWT